MEHDLIARYIYAVTRHLPPKMRADVEKELDALISDMLEARCGAVLPTEKDIRVVLTELGAPEALAAQYCGDENRAFISGPYLLLYKRVLQIVLPILGVIILCASFLGILLGESLPSAAAFSWVIGSLGQSLGATCSGVFQAFGVITIVFAIMEHKKVMLVEGDMFSRLPTVPKAQARIPIHEPILGIIWAILFAVLLLAFPWFAGAWIADSGWIPVFITEALRSLWVPILLWSMLGVVKEAAKLWEGQHTKRLALITTVLNLPILGCVVWMFASSRIVNPHFVSFVGDIFAEEGAEWIATLFANFHLFLLGIICFAILLEIVTLFVKAYKYGTAKKSMG